MIAEAALNNRQKHFVIDDEAVARAFNGTPILTHFIPARQPRGCNFAHFDVLATDGGVLRGLCQCESPIWRDCLVALDITRQGDAVIAVGWLWRGRGRRSPEIHRQGCGIVLLERRYGLARANSQSMVLQAASASTKVRNGEPVTFTAPLPE